MREINLERSMTAAPKHTYLVYGASRSGKTTYAATFPRPLFLSDVAEGGWESIINIDDTMLFEAGVMPIVWGIEHMTDMAEALIKAGPLIDSGQVQTLVVDSATFYIDMMLNFYLAAQTKSDTRAAYGSLGNHLRDLRLKLHARNVNVVWLALAKDPDGADPVGGPMIPGQQAAKLAASCHFIFHSRIHQERRGQELLPPTYEMRTRKWGGYMAGNRLGGRANDLPDPLVNTVYADLLEHLGYDYGVVRDALPKFPTKTTNSKAAKVVVAAQR